MPCRTIDSICADLDRVDFLKIDAEGAEPLIFRGMQETLTRFKPDMILEFNYRRYADPHGFIADIMRHYPRLRYLDDSSNIADVSIPPARNRESR